MEEQKHTPGPIKGNCPTCGILCVIAGNDNYYPVTNGLLERVSSLTKENERLKIANERIVREANQDLLTIGEQMEQINQLKAERKEMVEALRARMDGLEDYNNEYFFLESLLFKFEP